jgi:hypothetical protein
MLARLRGVDDSEAWTLERSFWTGDPALYAQGLDPAGLMVFPPPAGIMDAEAARAGIAAGPRWREVRFADRRIARAADGLLVLAYRAQADREGGQTYEAYCSSVYRKAGEHWLLLLHQQTPA